MSRGGASIARQIKRGKRDELGRPLQKRPFNNKKRTLGRQGQEDVKGHYLEMMERMRYIKYLCNLMKEANEYLTEENWLKTIRKYDEHKLFIDDYEKRIIVQNVNHGR